MNANEKILLMFMCMSDEMDPGEQYEEVDEDYINHYDDLDDLKLMEEFYEEENYPEEIKTV